MAYKITKLVENCIQCGDKLPENNKHHSRCHKCWCFNRGIILKEGKKTK